LELKKSMSDGIGKFRKHKDCGKSTRVELRTETGQKAGLNGFSRLRTSNPPPEAPIPVRNRSRFSLAMRAYDKIAKSEFLRRQGAAIPWPGDRYAPFKGGRTVALLELV
jgi:hypothetical protein